MPTHPCSLYIFSLQSKKGFFLQLRFCRSRQIFGYLHGRDGRPRDAVRALEHFRHTSQDVATAARVTWSRPSIRACWLRDLKEVNTMI